MAAAPLLQGDASDDASPDHASCRGARFWQTADHRRNAGPRPADDQILVKIAASGVCHTDLHAAEGDWPVKPHPPFIPGHEGVGHVAAVGKNVKHVKEGDRVGVPWLHSACGFCRHCIGGWETCANLRPIPATRSTAALPTTHWPTPTMWATCRPM
jgi:D-arabinose 1-dehydrogenase-like Zn-dependent alcohol dehydrogenase